MLLLIACQLVTILLDHLSFVEQATHHYVHR